MALEAESGIMATWKECWRKAGDEISASGATSLQNADYDFSIAASGAAMNNFIEQAEAFVNVATRINWSDKYDSLNNDVKKMLQDTVTNLAGIYMISHDLHKMTDRLTAEDMINVLRDAALRNLAILRDKKFSDFMEDA